MEGTKPLTPTTQPLSQGLQIYASSSHVLSDDFKLAFESRDTFFGNLTRDENRRNKNLPNHRQKWHRWCLTHLSRISEPCVSRISLDFWSPWQSSLQLNLLKKISFFFFSFGPKNISDLLTFLFNSEFWTETDLEPIFLGRDLFCKKTSLLKRGKVNLYYIGIQPNNAAIM